MLSFSSSSSSFTLFNTFTTKNTKKVDTFPTFSTTKPHFSNNPFHYSKNPSFPPKNPQISPTKTATFVPNSASFGSEDAETSAEVSISEEDEWLSKLPDKKKPLYAHSLPCIESWLRNLGFYQSRDDRAVWFVEKLDWHAQLSLDVTDLYIRYLKNGPGNLEKDMERRFSYALSREDIENAVLGGP